VWHFLARRLALLAATLLLVSAIAFLLPYLEPGDPVRAIVRSRVAEVAIDPATVAALRHKLGLDRPLALQYLAWLLRALHGDLGYSYTSRLPVSASIFQALGVSATLAVVALAIAFLVAIPLGTAAAVRPGALADGIVTVLAQSLVAAPEYLLAPVGILLFAVHVHWLPAAGWQGPPSVVLPALVLSLRPLAYFTQIIRASMIDVLGARYIMAARSRGLGLVQTLARHGIRNAIMPVLTLFAVWLAGLLGGAVVVEVIFAIPGMGRLLYDAVVNQDIPMLQGGLICTVALAVIINTLADFSYAAINPTIRMPHAAD
jgi:peptide/nickel transport system permease protein